MRDAYAKKLRFVPVPGEPSIIPEHLIPDDCRDEYGIDAEKLVKRLVQAWTDREKENAVVTDILALMFVKVNGCKTSCPVFETCGHSEKECVERLVERVRADVRSAGLDTFFEKEAGDEPE